LLFTLALAELSLNQGRRVVHDVGLASISLFTVVIAVFLGSSLLYKEIERKTLYVILPKPIRRWEFLVGKYIGIAITGIVFIAIMGAIQLWVTATGAGASPALLAATPPALLAVLGVALWRARDRTAVLVPWSLLSVAACAAVCATTDVALTPIAAALVLTAGELMLLSAVALFFSSFSTPFLTGAFTLGVWLLGRSAGEMATTRSTVLTAELKEALRVTAEVVPNFQLFVPGRHALEVDLAALGGPWAYVAQTMAYGALYTAVVLGLASLVFRRRDFL
jgi:ABC-type transport system involved in multi-copper enzyme maturation permease subunit